MNTKNQPNKTPQKASSLPCSHFSEKKRKKKKQKSCYSKDNCLNCSHGSSSKKSLQYLRGLA